MRQQANEGIVRGSGFRKYCAKLGFRGKLPLSLAGTAYGMGLGIGKLSNMLEMRSAASRHTFAECWLEKGMPAVTE